MSQVTVSPPVVTSPALSAVVQLAPLPEAEMKVRSAGRVSTISTLSAWLSPLLRLRAVST